MVATRLCERCSRDWQSAKTVAMLPELVRGVTNEVTELISLKIGFALSCDGRSQDMFGVVGVLLAISFVLPRLFRLVERTFSRMRRALCQKSNGCGWRSLEFRSLE
jgi:hypothetical protein